MDANTLCARDRRRRACETSRPNLPLVDRDVQAAAEGRPRIADQRVAEKRHDLDAPPGEARLRGGPGEASDGAVAARERPAVGGAAPVAGARVAARRERLLRRRRLDRRKRCRREGHRGHFHALVERKGLRAAAAAAGAAVLRRTQVHGVAAAWIRIDLRRGDLVEPVQYGRHFVRPRLWWHPAHAERIVVDAFGSRRVNHVRAGERHEHSHAAEAPSLRAVDDVEAARLLLVADAAAIDHRRRAHLDAEVLRQQRPASASSTAVFCNWVHDRIGIKGHLAAVLRADAAGRKQQLASGRPSHVHLTNRAAPSGERVVKRSRTLD